MEAKLFPWQARDRSKDEQKNAVFDWIGFGVGGSAGKRQPKYDPGASDTEIKIGNVAPYSGPVSLYGAVGKVEAAFFKMVNDQGGINGRKVNFISYDDAYSPPKTLEQTRRLVESDEVLTIFSPVGAPTNSAIQRYLNGKKFPTCSSRQPRRNGTIRSIFRGRWAWAPRTRARVPSLRVISNAKSPTPR